MLDTTTLWLVPVVRWLLVLALLYVAVDFVLSKFTVRHASAMHALSRRSKAL